MTGLWSVKGMLSSGMVRTGSAEWKGSSLHVAPGFVLSREDASLQTVRFTTQVGPICKSETAAILADGQVGHIIAIPVSVVPRWLACCFSGPCC